MLPSQQIHKELRHNTIVNLLDGGFFGFALGFASFSTVIPLFVANLTDSATLIGLVPAIHAVGWQFPQLLTARSVSRMSQFKPFVMVMTIHERLPFLFLGLLAALSPLLCNRWTLFLVFVLLSWQGLGGGFTANAWQNLIGKIIPSQLRATFFGSQSAAANLFAGIGAILAGLLLEKLAFPGNFVACFLIASVFMTISWYFLNLTREPTHILEPLPTEKISFWGNIASILQTDKGFRWFIISRIVFQFATMATAFYAVHAVKNLGMGEVAAGVMTSVLFITQVVSNVLFGWIADQKGRLPVLKAGAVTALIAAGIAWLAPSFNWFFLIMIFAGAANSVFWTVGISASLEFGPESDRPIYVGMANTLIAPSAILAPLLGGWLADLSGYQTTFLVSAILGILAFAVLHFFVRIPQNKAK